ncbi:MAG: YggS family pyridoxal phosphate-dependent enzyme [Chloroflexi bacterium]|nr:YggS family pyridoxal phosphate-dependent enzyme [Chloroflexota bacterium]
MDEKAIANAVKRIRETLPPGVILVAAAKSRTVEEVRAAIRAGVSHVGHNYVQEAAQMIPLIPEPVQWHMIGHLQTNKAKSAVQLFDMIETLDSWRLAQELEKRCAALGKVMPVLIEVNSGREASKTGVLPEEVEQLAWQVSTLPHLRLQGLMTMGPRFGNPEDARPYFRITREIFERLKATHIPNVEMRYLSMGMSNSYLVAIEEGANMVRIGTLLFGERAE